MRHGTRRQFKTLMSVSGTYRLFFILAIIVQVIHMKKKSGTYDERSTTRSVNPVPRMLSWIQIKVRMSSPHASPYSQRRDSVYVFLTGCLGKAHEYVPAAGWLRLGHDDSKNKTKTKK